MVSKKCKEKKKNSKQHQMHRLDPFWLLLLVMIMAVKVVVVIGGPMVWVIVMEDGGGGGHEMGARGTSKIHGSLPQVPSVVPESAHILGCSI